MARDLVGGGTSDHLDTTANTDMDFNDECLCMAVLFRPTSTEGRVFATEQNPANGFGCGWNSSDRFKLTKVGEADVFNFSATIPTGVWLAMLWHTGTGLDATFKYLRFDTDALTEVSTSNTATLVAPSSAVQTIGNRPSPATIDNPDAHVHSVVYLNETVYTADEFRAWAYSQRIPRGVAAGSWILQGDGPEIDLAGNGNTMAVTGTSVVDGPPYLAPTFGMDQQIPYEVAAAAGDLEFPYGEQGVMIPRARPLVVPY